MQVDQALYLEGAGVPAEIEYELVHEKLYEPEASEYVGKAEECTMFFDALPEQLPGMDTLTRIITEAIVENIVLHDGVMLRIRIYNAKGEWYNSKWKVEAAVHSSPFPWAVVIPLILVAVIVIGLTLISHNVKDLDWGKAALVGLGAGLLILLIAAALGGRKKKKKEAA